MQRVIYADILIFINAVITLLMLLTASDIIKIYSTRKRYLLGAFMGGIGSLLLLIPEMNAVLSFAVKLLQCLIIVLCVFGFKKRKPFLKATAGLILSCFLYGGTVFFVQYFLFPDYIYIKNGYVYFDIGTPGLILVCFCVFAVFKFADKRLFKRRTEDIIYSVSLNYGGNTYSFKALLDSGNRVVDCYTGHPVIILSFSVISDAFSQEERGQVENIFRGDVPMNLPQKIRLLPVKTLGTMKMMPTLTAEKAVVYNGEFRKTVIKPSIVLSNDTFDEKKYLALINSNITGQVL